MLFRYFAVTVALLALVLAACGSDESGECQCIGEPIPVCKAYCSTESTAEAALPLSVGLTIYTVTAQNAPGTATACNDAGSGAWCKCGTDYTDAAARCNTATETLLVRVPALGCEAGTATLSYQVSTWAGATTVDVRRILRPVTDPTMGVAGLCASTAQASWFRSGPEAWTTPGGKGDGSDRSAAQVTKALASAPDDERVKRLVAAVKKAHEAPLSDSVSKSFTQALGLGLGAAAAALLEPDADVDTEPEGVPA